MPCASFGRRSFVGEVDVPIIEVSAFRPPLVDAFAFDFADFLTEGGGGEAFVTSLSDGPLSKWLA